MFERLIWKHPVALCVTAVCHGHIGLVLVTKMNPQLKNGFANIVMIMPNKVYISVNILSMGMVL